MRIVFGVLVFFLLALLVYSNKELSNWFAPNGAIIQNLIPQVAGMIVELGVIAALATYLLDRKWNPTRDHIKESIATDLDALTISIAGYIDFYRQPDSNDLDGGALLMWGHFNELLNADVLRQRLQYLTPAFTPELAKEISEYMMFREEISRSIGKIDSEADISLFLSSLANEKGYFTPSSSDDVHNGKLYGYAKAVELLRDFFDSYHHMATDDGDATGFLSITDVRSVLSTQASKAELCRKELWVLSASNEDKK